MEIFIATMVPVQLLTFAAVVRLNFMVGGMVEQHKSHDRRLTKLENKKC